MHFPSINCSFSGSFGSKRSHVITRGQKVSLYKNHFHKTNKPTCMLVQTDGQVVDSDGGQCVGESVLFRKTIQGYFTSSHWLELNKQNAMWHAYTHTHTVSHETEAINIIHLKLSFFPFISTVSGLHPRWNFPNLQHPHFCVVRFINQSFYHSHRPNTFFPGNEDIVESIRCDGPDVAVVFHVRRSLDSLIAARAKRKVLLSPECSVM